MIPFLIVLLVISQLVCFYFMIILNMKVAKFKELEVRQDKLIREMDDAISVYLMEMREENNRLIQELSNLKKYEMNNNENNVANLESTSLNETEIDKLFEKESEFEKELVLDQTILIPKTLVKNAYNRQKEQALPSKNQNEVELVQSEIEQEVTGEISSLEQQVVKLHHEGKTIEEIAKITQKGKTEIELLIKFHV